MCCVVAVGMLSQGGGSVRRNRSRMLLMLMQKKWSVPLHARSMRKKASYVLKVTICHILVDVVNVPQISQQNTLVELSSRIGAATNLSGLAACMPHTKLQALPIVCMTDAEL